MWTGLGLGPTLSRVKDRTGPDLQTLEALNNGRAYFVESRRFEVYLDQVDLHQENPF